MLINTETFPVYFEFENKFPQMYQQKIPPPPALVLEKFNLYHT